MFRTQKEEEKIMTKGRIKCASLIGICALLVFAIFRVKFDFKSFWLFRRSQTGFEINVIYSGLTFGVLVFSYMLYEPFTLKIQRCSFNCPKLGQNHIKIAHISDTHIHYPYPQVTLKSMKKIVAKINKENPDFVVHTGDIMSDGSPNAQKDIDDMMEALKGLNAPLYVCFGNHDVACHEELVRRLHDIGAITLEQATEEINIRGVKIYISGIVPSLDIHKTDSLVREVANNFKGDPSCTHILLAHMPDAADSAASTGAFCLQLSGHSHGGQCVLPFNGGTPLLPPGCIKYHACTTNNYVVGEMILHISRGLGVTPLPFPPIRFLCKPEFSILTLYEDCVL